MSIIKIINVRPCKTLVEVSYNNEFSGKIKNIIFYREENISDWFIYSEDLGFMYCSVERASELEKFYQEFINKN